MKEYKVDVIGITLKTKKSLKECLQKLIDERVSQGYELHSFGQTVDFCTVIFEKAKKEI